MIYALIKDGMVKNTIVCEESFISNIESQYDHCERIDHLELPPKWTKDGEEDIFEQPMLDENTPDDSWTFVPGVQRPSIGWLYDGVSFSQE